MAILINLNSLEIGKHVINTIYYTYPRDESQVSCRVGITSAGVAIIRDVSTSYP